MNLHNNNHDPKRPSSGGTSSANSSNSLRLTSSSATCGQKCWRFWRKCCCRSGGYPLLVAPVLTAACLLSLYSTAGCEFVDLQVGFTPSNDAYNRSTALLGFFYHNSNYDHHDDILDTLHSGCSRYTNIFEQDFIGKDRTWKVSRIMALISAIGSLLCGLLIWLFVITPLPTRFIWPGVLLPLVMLSFIAEGSKFLIFDIALCSNALWLPSGVDSPAQSAQSCGLGQTAIYGIASASLMLLSLLLVCLKTPERRDLDPNYGLVLFLGNEHDMEPTEVPMNPDDEGDISKNRQMDDEDIEGFNAVMNLDEETSHAQSSVEPSMVSSSTPGTSGASSGAAGGAAAWDVQKSNDTPTKPSSHIVSESRVSIMEQMEQNTAFEESSKIQQLVSDLDSSLGPAS